MTSLSRPIVDETNAPALLPHAPPFRLVDRVVAADLAAGTLMAERRITACALWPGGLRFPEVLVIEALCQAAACLNILDAAPPVDQRAARQHHGYLVAISNFRFQQDFDSAQSPYPTVGDSLILKVKRQSRLGALLAFFAEAQVLTHTVASGQLLFAIG
jgi:3-hydroxymyristoyl/3-hydroxydecanoyl-(acyl carrier protein) dehydratase